MGYFKTTNRKFEIGDFKLIEESTDYTVTPSNPSIFVKIKLEDQFLTLTSSSVNGKVYDEMDAEHEGRDLEIGFNCRYLINSIKVAEGEKINLTFKSETQAITIEPNEKEEDFNYFYMILPVRMSEK